MRRVQEKARERWGRSGELEGGRGSVFRVSAGPEPSEDARGAELVVLADTHVLVCAPLVTLGSPRRQADGEGRSWRREDGSHV